MVQILEEENSKVDELSRLDPFDPGKIARVFIEHMDPSSMMIGSTVLVIGLADWKSHIISYLSNPPMSDDFESARIRIKASRYILIDDGLYKKSFTLPYLCCLSLEKAVYALREIHKGICE